MTTAALEPAVPSEISQMCEHGCPSPFEMAAPKNFQAWCSPAGFGEGVAPYPRSCRAKSFSRARVKVWGARVCVLIAGISFPPKTPAALGYDPLFLSLSPGGPDGSCDSSFSGGGGSVFAPAR